MTSRKTNSYLLSTCVLGAKRPMKSHGVEIHDKQVSKPDKLKRETCHEENKVT